MTSELVEFFLLIWLSLLKIPPVLLLGSNYGICPWDQNKQDTSFGSIGSWSPEVQYNSLPYSLWNQTDMCQLFSVSASNNQSVFPQAGAIRCWIILGTNSVSWVFPCWSCKSFVLYSNLVPKQVQDIHDRIIWKLNMAFRVYVLDLSIDTLQTIVGTSFWIRKSSRAV